MNEPSPPTKKINIKNKLMPPENPLSPVGRFRQKIRKHPALVPLLTQGDSWFAFPALLRTNLIDVLVKVNDGCAAWLRLQSLESSGEEVRQMLSGREYQHMLAILSGADAQIRRYSVQRRR